ncbi:MAG TPA: L-threonylcarbamoyladenylate synthase [Phycisphaerales bacterium]|nr:L-threonylcarbamoyladenylate synthase [Phycisphaerales bacterium]
MAHGPGMLQEAVSRLAQGRLVAFPTETVYGLGADALNSAAVARVFAAKGRPSNNPLIVHVADVAQAALVTSSWPREAQLLADAFWPGPLSMVLPKASRVPLAVTAQGENVAVRCPDHPLTLELLRAFGKPLVGPSANKSGGVSPTRAEHVREAFDAETVYVLDGGPCTAGIESTVLLLAEQSPRVLRPGLISADEIASVLQQTVTDFSPGAQHAGVLQSPGLLEKHYAPTTPTRQVSVDELAAQLAAVGRAVVISHAAVVVAPPHEVQLLPADARGYAAGLYAALRAADARGADCIFIVEPPRTGTDASIWRAVADRVRRATA